jgi:hypothetical protein
VAVHLPAGPRGDDGDPIPLGPDRGRQRVLRRHGVPALGHTGTEALADAAAVAFCLLAYLGTAGLAGRAREVLDPKIGTSHAAVIRYAIVLLGGLATILITLQLFGIAVTQLLVGGALATILVASRRSRASPTCSQAWSCCSPGRSTSVTRC